MFENELFFKKVVVLAWNMTGDGAQETGVFL